MNYLIWPIEMFLLPFPLPPFISYTCTIVRELYVMERHGWTAGVVFNML